MSKVAQPGLCVIPADGNQPNHFRPNRRRGPRRNGGVGSNTQTTTTRSSGLCNSTRASSHGRANILGSPNGAVEVNGGTFNATAGHHINVTINAGGDGTVPKRKRSRGKKAILTTQDENAPHVETSRGKSPNAGSENEESMWPPTIPTQKGCEIYYRHLAAKGRGSPLWIPEPNKALSIEYQMTGMRVGDVGIITDRGGFDFLFNICHPADHPINRKKVPENFVPLLIDLDDIQKYSEFKADSYLSSASIKKSYRDGDSSYLHFESSASEGAILTMPAGSNSEDLRNVSAFRKYAAFHAEDWYKYVNNVRGREARNGDVRLVTGYDKTTAWGMAAFSNSTAQNDSFQLKFGPMENNRAGGTYGWEYSGMAEVRAGPDACEVEALRRGDSSQERKKYENQCLFVRTLNVTLQGTVWKKLASEFGEVDVDEGPSDSSDLHLSSSTRSAPTISGSSSRPLQSTSSPGSPIALAPSQDMGAGQGFRSAYTSPSTSALTIHPCDMINEMLLNSNPSARIAITEDKDWISVMKKDDTMLPSKQDLYARIMSSFLLRQEEGMLFLEKVENQPPNAEPAAAATPAAVVPAQTQALKPSAQQTHPFLPEAYQPPLIRHQGLPSPVPLEMFAKGYELPAPDALASISPSDLQVEAVTCASQFPLFARRVLEAHPVNANLILPHLQMCSQIGGNVLEGQLWIIIRSTDDIKFIVSCTTNYLGEYSIFFFTPIPYARLHRDTIFPPLQMIAETLFRYASVQRVYSIFAPEVVTRIFAGIWANLTRTRVEQEPYYHAKLSYLTNKTFTHKRIRPLMDETCDTRLGIASDIPGIAELCYLFAADSAPSTLTRESALKEATILVNSRVVWVYAVALPVRPRIAAIIATTRNTEDIATITKVFTHPDFRGRGCGEQLMRLVCEELLTTKLYVVSYVGIDNRAANVYQRVGFVGVGDNALPAEDVNPWLELGFDRTHAQLGHW